MTMGTRPEFLKVSGIIVRKQQYKRDNNELVLLPDVHQSIGNSGFLRIGYITREKKMTKAIILSMCLAVFSLALNARAADAPRYKYGPVTEVDYIHVEYGHFEDYMAWVTSTWVPTMEAEKKAGLIIGYKVFRAEPKSPDQPNVYLEITFKDIAAYPGDIGDQAPVDAFEAVTEKVICDAACQNQARVHRGEIRRLLGTEVTREILF